jgi:hypothetical protein
MIPRIFKTATRRLAWKVLAEVSPCPEVHPRFRALDYAIKNIHHHTRVARSKCKPGQRGTLMGDYLEFGCYEGDSFRCVLQGAAQAMPWMRFFAFDSFQGLPKPQGPDQNGTFREGEYACSQEAFLRNVQQPDVHSSRIICVPGWYNQSLTPEVKRRHNLTVAAIVNLDCDLYESTVPVLHFLTDIIETGSILLFDDWFCFKGDPERGVQRATAEWLAVNPNVRLQDWHLFGGFGKSFIVVKTGG